VLDAGETGCSAACTSTRPTADRRRDDAVSSWWVVDGAAGTNLERTLDEVVPRWLTETWGFESVDTPLIAWRASPSGDVPAPTGTTSARRRASSPPPIAARSAASADRGEPARLIRPLGLGEGRRHAHIACVARAATQGAAVAHRLASGPAAAAPRWWPFGR